MGLDLGMGPDLGVADKGSDLAAGAVKARAGDSRAEFEPFPVVNETSAARKNQHPVLARICTPGTREMAQMSPRSELLPIIEVKPKRAADIHAFTA
jgi:hypothetical protein